MSSWLLKVYYLVGEGGGRGGEGRGEERKGKEREVECRVGKKSLLFVGVYEINCDKNKVDLRQLHGGYWTR